MLWLVTPHFQELYPQLTQATAVALTAPVQIVNVERLFSAHKLVSN